jgi:quercetin dioxygenase-like cupin family protein
MPLYNWEKIDREQVNPLMARRMIHSDTMTIARLELRKGASVPEHSHHNEQVSTVESGRMRFNIGGEEMLLGPGDCLHIPPHVPHSAEVLEDAIVTDIFSPRREDWIRGDDAYLRK